MKSLWNDKEAQKLKGDLLKLRVYTSRLLGANQDLVMHGGGNTSVKLTTSNLFGEKEDLLYVKGSGWDLGTIEPQGFAPVRMGPLLKMAELKELTDIDMVKNQRIAMTDPNAPNPSVEAILHAIIPYRFVDHTHADAVVTITNTPAGKDLIREIYGENMLIVPYVMPGFVLARKIYQMTRDIDWDRLDGMILLNHGVFTFDDDPRISYEKMISVVNKAVRYLDKHASRKPKGHPSKPDTMCIALTRKAVMDTLDKPVIAKFDGAAESVAFSARKDLKEVSGRGPITPDHIIRTKRTPVIIGSDPMQSIRKYEEAYQKYFEKYSDPSHSMLDTAPRWAFMPGSGGLYFGTSPKAVTIIQDIARHTQRAIDQAEQLSKWKPLGKKELFEMEYWSLEQAKLAKAGSGKPFQGKIAIVTGAASGIGKACVDNLVAEGAVVAALDIDKSILKTWDQAEVLPLVCDITKDRDIEKAIEAIVLEFGGIDLVVSNAGIFPTSAKIPDIIDKDWNKSLDINVTGHQKLIKMCVPVLENGWEPAIVIMGSKNVPAPGPGASTYSVAKAALTQFGRVAAMELAEKGIRVNMLHPNAVFDTGIWSEKVLQERAKHYGLSVQDYKTNNLLKVEVTSRDVAQMVTSMLSRTFSKVTGAQVPIDGGNERVI